MFVSYSRDDVSLVGPLVSLLRATRDLVFHDVDSIQPGQRWREQLEAALAASHLVVVFWCEHAADSAFVREEYERAIEDDKDVLPLLLDDTPLPPALGAYQWIDFRHVAGAAHVRGKPDRGLIRGDLHIEGVRQRESPAVPAPSAARPRTDRPPVSKAPRSFRWPLLAALLIVGVVGLFTFTLSGDGPAEDAAAPISPLLWGIAGVLALVLVLAYLVRARRSASRAAGLPAPAPLPAPPAPAPAPPESPPVADMHRAMAERLGAELEARRHGLDASAAAP